MNYNSLEPITTDSINTIEISWNKIIIDFLNSVDLRQSTLNSYRRRLRRWSRWLADNNIQHPLPTDLIKFKKYLALNCNSVLTICNYLTAIRSLLSWTHKRKIYPNISGEVRNPQRPRGFRKDSLELSEVNLLLESIDRSTLKGKRDYAICRLLTTTGPRSIEIYRADIQDIKKEKGKWILYLQGKGRDEKDEFISLTSNTLNALEDYLKKRKYLNSREPLFTSLSSNHMGKRLSTRSIRKIIKSCFKNIGLNSNRLTCHSLRHTCITLSLLAGNSLQETKELARHQDINTTLMYAHNLKRLEGKAEEAIEDLLTSNC